MRRTSVSVQIAQLDQLATMLIMLFGGTVNSTKKLIFQHVDSTSKVSYVRMPSYF